MNKKKILCFGDSNTWGYHPEDESRIPDSQRWPTLLQEQLGSQYKVIEEGLNGRTTNVDYVDRLGKNGRQYFIPCLTSHFRLDHVILFLGTNDLKSQFRRTPQQITDAMEELILTARGKDIERDPQMPTVIVVAGPLMQEKFIPAIYGDEMKGSEAGSKELVGLYRSLAQKMKTKFVDLSGIPTSPHDGIHWDIEAQPRVAQAILNAIMANN